MALSSCLLLLLVTHWVLAQDIERHYIYHIHMVHYSPLQNDSLKYIQQSAAILTDGKQLNYYTGGKNMVSTLKEKASRSRMRHTSGKQSFVNEFEAFDDLLEISPNDTLHYEKRRGCEIERSSTGDVTVLKSVVEYRHNGHVVLFFNANTVQWEALDLNFIPVKIKWDNLVQLNQFLKHYVMEGCVETLIKYLNALSTNVITETQTLSFFTERNAVAWPEEKEGWSFSFLMLLIVCLLIACTVLRRRKYAACALLPCLNQSIHLHFNTCRRPWSAEEPPGREDLNDDDDDYDDDDDDDDDDDE